MKSLILQLPLAVGHQWYCTMNSETIPPRRRVYSFELPLPAEDLDKGQLRMLEVDERVVLPVNTTFV